MSIATKGIMFFFNPILFQKLVMWYFKSKVDSMTTLKVKEVRCIINTGKILPNDVREKAEYQLWMYNSNIFLGLQGNLTFVIKHMVEDLILNIQSNTLMSRNL